MKIKLILIEIMVITSLNAAQVFTNPLGSAFKSTDNGLHEVAGA